MEHDFRRDLSKLGINRGDTVLMHSSMKALGTDKTPQELIQCVLDVLGLEGTLLVPALTYDNVTQDS